MSEGWIAFWLVVGVAGVVAWSVGVSWLWDQWWDERFRARMREWEREQDDEEREDL